MKLYAFCIHHFFFLLTSVEQTIKQVINRIFQGVTVSTLMMGPVKSPVPQIIFISHYKERGDFFLQLNQQEYVL